mgnify:FL=1
MRYHNITKDDMLNGDGLRVVLWVAGCNHCCRECQNPITWDPNGGLPFTEAEEAEIFTELDKDYIGGTLFREVIRCIHPIFLRLLLSQKKFVRNIQIRRSGCIQVPYGKKSVMKRLYSIWMSVWTVNFRLIKEILLFAGRAHPISV